MENNNKLPIPLYFSEEPDGEADIILEHDGCPLITIRGTVDMSCLEEDELVQVAAEQVKLAKYVLEACNNYAKLKIFKEYVHKRLDAMGISIDPESPHKAEGCRIGGRLDEVEKIVQNYKLLSE